MTDSKSIKLQGVKGMNDVLPDDAGLWVSLERKLSGWFSAYGYRNFRTPILEQTALFKRGIGEATDIVEKEMFSFTDRLNGDELTMRLQHGGQVAEEPAHWSLQDQGVVPVDQRAESGRPGRAGSLGSRHEGLLCGVGGR